MHSLSFDKPVYKDSGLTIEATGPFDIGSTTRLPKSIYFSNTEYIATGKNTVGDTLWTVRFTYPNNFVGDQISLLTGAIYDE